MKDTRVQGRAGAFVSKLTCNFISLNCSSVAFKCCVGGLFFTLFATGSYNYESYVR